MKLDNRRVKKFWDENMVLYGILRESKSPEIARNHLHNYLSEQWRMLYQKEGIQLSLEWSVQLAALRTFRRVISERSEKLTGSSMVTTLWHLANIAVICNHDQVRILRLIFGMVDILSLSIDIWNDLFILKSTAGNPLYQ